MKIYKQSKLSCTQKEIQSFKCLIINKKKGESKHPDDSLLEARKKSKKQQEIFIEVKGEIRR